MIRNKSIDIMKGIGILLVILGHLQNVIDHKLLLFIYSFHIPLFYFISGYLYNSKNELISYKNFFIKKYNSLIYPYFTFTVINFIYFVLKNKGVGIIRYILSFLYSNYIFDTNYVGTIWFLCSLFVVEILFYLIKKTKKQYVSLYVLFLTFVGFIIKCLYFNYIHVRLPFWIDISLFGLFFYYIGYLSKKIKYKKSFLLILPVLFFINIISIHLNNVFFGDKLLNGRTDMLYLKFGNELLFIVGALSGIFIIYFISNAIQKNKLLELFGKNSLIIMSLHIMFLQMSQKIVLLIFNGVPAICIIYVITCIISLCSSIFINKYLKFIVKKGK